MTLKYLELKVTFEPTFRVLNKSLQGNKNLIRFNTNSNSFIIYATNI